MSSALGQASDPFAKPGPTRPVAAQQRTAVLCSIARHQPGQAESRPSAAPQGAVRMFRCSVPDRLLHPISRSLLGGLGLVDQHSMDHRRVANGFLTDPIRHHFAKAARIVKQGAEKNFYDSGASIQRGAGRRESHDWQVIIVS